MGLFSNATFNNLNDLLIEQLQDLYDAEHRLTDALPLMRDAASSSDLKDAFEFHLQETENHIRRLENVFAQLGIEAERQTCPAMKGLIKEGQEMIDAEGDPERKGLRLDCCRPARRALRDGPVMDRFEPSPGVWGWGRSRTPCR